MSKDFHVRIKYPNLNSGIQVKEKVIEFLHLPFELYTKHAPQGFLHTVS